MPKDKKILFLFLACILSGGCSQQRILEEQAMVQATSFDLIKEETGTEPAKIRVSDALPQDRSTQKVLTAVARSSKEARAKINSQTNLNIVSGQLRTFLFSESLAKKGLLKYTDTLERDPAISQQTNMVLVEGNAYKMLSGDYKQKEATYAYLDSLIEKAVKSGDIPESKLFHFVRSNVDEGTDPVMPILVKKKDHVDYNGLALFRDDRYIAKLSRDEGILFSMMTENLDAGQINFELQAKKSRIPDFLAFALLRTSRKVKVEYTADKKLKVNLRIKASGSIMEFIGDRSLKSAAARKRLEGEMEAYFERKANRLIKVMQREKADSLGLGQYVRNSIGYSKWKEMNWRKEYSSIPISCQIELAIKDFGKAAF
ncbi:Ger(x)C family spore germination protein [Peribacillus sp. SCS-37]|uniref:Ger(x)C family spore germination protein n=1 Tax=Paraperibacillus esterisolvens TaxID=3115296 RepID=UPI0039060C26